MKEYDPNEFISAIRKKTMNKQIVCPYCQGMQFTSTQEFASILIGKDLATIHIGSSVPAGMIICQNCGHIDFFALGALNLLEGKTDNNGKQ